MGTVAYNLIKTWMDETLMTEIIKIEDNYRVSRKTQKYFFSILDLFLVVFWPSDDPNILQTPK